MPLFYSLIFSYPQALGMELTFTEGKGPQLANPIQSESAVNELAINMDVLTPIYETIRILRQELPAQTTQLALQARHLRLHPT